jgi:hypothetical protein
MARPLSLVVFHPLSEFVLRVLREVGAVISVPIALFFLFAMSTLGQEQTDFLYQRE